MAALCSGERRCGVDNEGRAFTEPERGVLLSATRGTLLADDGAFFPAEGRSSRGRFEAAGVAGDRPKKLKSDFCF